MNSFKRLKSLGKPVYGWALYDWANSAFATTVIAGFFPIFFKSYWAAGVDVNDSSAYLAFANSLSGLIVLLLAPVLGAIADKASARKKFLLFFAYLGVLMTAALFTVQQGQWQLAALLYVIGGVGFSAGNSFYDSLIPAVTGEKDVDFVSGFGFSLGYLGGGLLFLINVLMYLFPEAFGISDGVMAVRIAFISVALWWGLFTLFLAFWVEEEKADQGGMSYRQAVREGIGQLAETLRNVMKLPMTFLFLLAYFLYIDGVDTIIRMAVDYGLSLGFGQEDLITALLLVQFVGFPAAIIYAKLGEAWSVRKAIFLGIIIYMSITVLGIQMKSKTEFYLLAVMVGLTQGGIQALSRSFYSRIIPRGQAGQFFGFYNMIGKSAVFIGPLIMGVVVLFVRYLLTDVVDYNGTEKEIANLASRWSLAAILLFFISGGLIFYYVDEDQAREQVQAYEAELRKK